MSRIAILSDVHGNLEALAQVLEDIRAFDVEAIYSLGDQIGYGPQPQECVDLLREHEVSCLMGNHEQGLINILYLRRFNQPAADSLRRTREMITEATFQWLITRPKAMVVHGCRMVHGLPPDSVNEYLYKYKDDAGALFGRFTEDVCFVGHTHDLMRFTWNRSLSTRLELPEGETRLESGLRHLVNIGAVGQPRDGDNRAKWALYETGTRVLTLRFVAYDIQKTVDLILKHGFHRGFADRLW